jgi:cellulose synthase/poly-beta-1,6-N-acetylglucosamine synthase-like glycosyltransferase
MNGFLAIISIWLLLQLLYPAVAVLLAQWRKPKPVVLSNDTRIQFACIITAYRNMAIARPLVQSLLQQTCPDLRIYLVADECPDLDFQISDERFHLLKPEQPLRLKVKSIQYAMDRLVEPPDYVVIFDADNLAHPDFLLQLKPWIQSGFRCVQGQRTAKNLDTTYAALDSLGEHYKNYLEREVPFRLGASAVISGSGMATEKELYQAYLQSPEIIRGREQWKKMLQEDKILQNFLVRRDERIAYVREALVYDEKVATGKDVETQRSRWLYSYFQNMPNALGLIGKGLINGSFNQIYFGGITLVLPMFIQVGLATCCMILALCMAPVCAFLLGIGLCVFALNLMWVLHLDGAPQSVKRVIWHTPLFVFRQVFALLKMRNPNRNFHHTAHQKEKTIDEVLREKEERE